MSTARFADTAPQHRLPPEPVESDPAQAQIEAEGAMWAECDALADKIYGGILAANIRRRARLRAAPDCGRLHELLTEAADIVGKM